VKLIFVTRGFPPAGRWGSEGYAHDVARGLVARGHEVDVFFPVDGFGAVRGRDVSPGLRVFELPLRPRLGKPLLDSYHDPRQDHALATLIEREGPYDRAHFFALGGGVSVGMVPVAKQHGAEVLVTLTEFLLFCHRGQFLDSSIQPCERGPDPGLCSACITSTGPYAERSFKAAAKAGLVRVLMPVSNLLPRLPSPRAFRARERWIAANLAYVDRFIAPSPALRDRYIELGIDGGRIDHLPYALDPNRYTGYVPRPSRNGKPTRLQLTYMGQLSPHKGIHVLVDAVERIPRELDDRFVVRAHGVPTSHYHPRYGHELIDRVKAGDLPIEFPGPFPPDRLVEVLSDTDVVLIPSLWLENLPLVLLHARSCGVPVLASRVGGVAGFVKDGTDGLLAEPADPGDWADKLRRLIEQPDLLARLRSGAASAGIPMGFDEHLIELEKR